MGRWGFEVDFLVLGVGGGKDEGEKGKKEWAERWYMSLC